MAVTNATDAALVIQKIVSNVITETLIQEAVMLGSVLDKSAEVGPGMDRIDMPLVNELAIQDVDQNGAAVVPQTLNPFAPQLLLNRHKSVPFSITDKTSVQSKINLIQAAVKNGARSMAAEIDDFILGVLDAGVSAAGPDHRIALTGGDPLADISLAKKLLDDAKVSKNDRFLVASPGFLRALLGANNIIRVNEYGTSQGIQAGFVTDVYGFRILESSSASVIDDGFIAYQRMTFAFARQIAPQFKSEEKVLEHRTDYSLSHLYGGQITDATGVRIVVADANGLP